ncbi:MAG: HDIG domain-containing protein [Endomicrobiales bacterium]|nr:HDIG domain-containing protein [Endomicrobiales bacterium]
MLDQYWRKPLRKLLLFLLKSTEKKQKDSAVTRGGGQRIWQREIYIPAPVVSGLSILAFFVVLLFEVGLSWLKIAGLVLFLGLTYVFLAVYVRAESEDFSEDDESIMLLGLIFVGAVLTMQLFKKLLAPSATPVAAFSMLTALLLSRRLALVTAIILSLVLGVLNGLSLELFFIQFVSAVSGIIMVDKVRTRSDFTPLAARLVVVTLAAVLVLHFFRMWPVDTLGAMAVWAALSGIFSVLIVLGTLPFLESFFSKTTNLKLLELADFNQVLLKRLMIESPGTYHHSLIMASLAEQAAESIGANSLLARVGAYYHDIGKLKNPDYFIENQQPNANPHDPLSPSMSSLVIISHIKEGIALAQKHGIDRVIQDCIEQHHGTSLIHYFYHRALEENKEIPSENFRYPGPKPRTKETAILMLADAVEAASRSLDDPSPGRLRDLVEKVINNKFTDGQFSDCPITLHDLNSIAESLVSTLSGIHHARIEYQKTEKEQKD